MAHRPGAFEFGLKDFVQFAIFVRIFDLGPTIFNAGFCRALVIVTATMVVGVAIAPPT